MARWGSGGRTEEACGGGNEANRALVSLAFGVSALLPRSPAFSFPLHAPEALARSLLFCRLLLPAAPLTPALELAERRGSGDGSAPFRRTPRRESRPASGEGNGARGRRRRWAGRRDGASSRSRLFVGDLTSPSRTIGNRATTTSPAPAGEPRVDSPRTRAPGAAWEWDGRGAGARLSCRGRRVGERGDWAVCNSLWILPVDGVARHAARLLHGFRLMEI